jgi:imidazolonepropionase-like amidohydrolase
MKKMSFLLLVLLPALLLAQSQQLPQPKPLVFTHVTVIDATGASAKPNMTVVVTGDRITALGQTGRVAVPKEAEVVDATGKFLIPGLWDMHVHTITKDFLTLYIANGVTGVRDMFSTLEQINQWRKDITDGKFVGPRIVAAGPIVDGPKPVWPGSVAVSTDAQGRETVTSLKKQGVDFIKVYSLLPREAYLAIADEAKKQGIPFAGHVPISVSAAEASDAGQKSIEHLTGVLLGCSTKEAELAEEARQIIAKSETPMNEFMRISRAQSERLLASYSEEKAKALFARFAKNGTWQDATLTVLRSIASLDDSTFTNDPRLKYIPPMFRSFWNPKTDFRFREATAEDYARLRRNFERSLQLVGAMHRAGVPILAGTDTPNPYVFPGFSLHDELGLLVKAGLTPMEALQATTRNAAKYLGLLDSVGTIEKGKRADLVLLDANPLQDISNTQKIAAVVVRGTLVPKSELQKMLAEVEAANKN